MKLNSVELFMKIVELIIFVLIDYVSIFKNFINYYYIMIKMYSLKCNMIRVRERENICIYICIYFIFIFCIKFD